MRRIFCFFCLALLQNSYFGTNELILKNDTLSYIQPLRISSQNAENLLYQEKPNPILHLFKLKQQKNKKIIAALLAFPFPFGIVGLHRIYMGTSPHVPVVYIGTLGGIFGILPFIDFCVIVLDKNIDRYIENKQVLMWVDDSKKENK